MMCDAVLCMRITRFVLAACWFGSHFLVEWGPPCSVELFKTGLDGSAI
jgi:hypothetical protein